MSKYQFTITVNKEQRQGLKQYCEDKSLKYTCKTKYEKSGRPLETQDEKLLTFYIPYIRGEIGIKQYEAYCGLSTQSISRRLKGLGLCVKKNLNELTKQHTLDQVLKRQSAHIKKQFDIDMDKLWEEYQDTILYTDELSIFDETES